MPRQAKPWYRAERRGWYARVKGKQVRLCSEEEGHAEAVRRFHRLMAAEGKPVDPRRWTAAELLDLFLDHVQRTLKATTYGWYLGHLQSFADHAGKVPAVEVKPLHVSAWIEAHPTWGPSTRRGALTAIKRCWSWAKDEGHLRANPLAGIKRPRMGRRKVMSPSEAEVVVKAIRSESLRAFVLAMAETGARPGEISGIAAADVKCGSLEIRGKRGSRTIPLTARMAMLVDGLAAEHPEGPLFRNSRGRPWNRNALRCAFMRLRKATGIKNAVPYAFRHLYGTLAIERGVDSLLVAELMGHRDTSMLMEHYHHARQETLKRAAEQATKKAEGD